MHAHNHATARLVRRHDILEIRSTHHLFLKQKLGAPDKGTVLLCQQPMKKKYPRRCSKDTATISTSRSAAERGTAQGDCSQDNKNRCRRLARNRIEGVCLLHLGEIGNDSRFISIQKIHDENGRRSRVK